MLAVRAGQWLIRKWNDKNGGEYDLVRFKKHINEKYFFFSKYFRVKGNKAEDIMNCPFFDGDKTMAFKKDARMDYDFRLATKKEVRRLAKTIIECL